MHEVHDFQIEHHGRALVVIPSGSLESLQWQAVEHAAELVLAPLRDEKVPQVVFDLSQLNYFGSVFLALMLRCHKLVKSNGGKLVIACPSLSSKELLHVTALDTLWTIYDTRQAAIDAIGASS
ncbi:MAG: STAS domain-containing protein [Planctomycetaceae bacterium]